MLIAGTGLQAAPGDVAMFRFMRSGLAPVAAAWSGARLQFDTLPDILLVYVHARGMRP
jgi:hypothetical protein